MASSDRQRRILARLVAEYIEQGAPVSSAWLADNSGLGVSSATVRNVLARLEEQGLVRQPHTSAGRVPTDSGYRLYVDSLLDSRRPVRPSADVEARLRRSSTTVEMFQHVSEELARVSHQLGFVVSSTAEARLHHIDFASLGGRRVLIIVVASNGQVTHKAVETDAPVDETVLAQAANYLNAEFGGQTIAETRGAILERLREERVLYDALLTRALQLARTGLQAVAETNTIHVQGTAMLLDEVAADAAFTVGALRTLFEMIEDKQRLLDLLTRYLDGTGLMIVIGSEHVVPDFHPFSLVASTFTDGQHTGAIGVIGPTRMRYQRAISAVDALTQVMSRGLDG